MSINNEDDTIPSRVDLGLSMNRNLRCNSVKLLLICSLVFNVITLGFMVGLTIYLVPKIEQAEHTASRYEGTIDKATYVVDQADAFLTQDNIDKANRILNETDILLGRAMNIPMVDWDFITNTTYQTKLVYVVEGFLNHIPGLEGNESYYWEPDSPIIPKIDHNRVEL